MGQASPPLSAVVEQVAAHEQVAPEDLPALADAVPPEAYVRLTTAWDEQTNPIEFTYVWYHVTVYPGGEVIITP